MNSLKSFMIVLYVEDQEVSAKFYSKIFQQEPVLNVPGMTEFLVSPGLKLGLMPNNGIAKLMGDKIPHPNNGTGIPRCELYLGVENVDFEFDNAMNAEAMLVSPIADRDWGDRVCYFADPDGHIIAFAEKSI